MRIFSGTSEDIPEVKYHLARHKAFMTAGEIDSYKSVVTMSTGQQLTITSIEGIDNIVVGRKVKKIPLEEFVLPKQFQNQVLIWTGMADQERFPPETFSNLSRFWGSPVVSEALPSNLAPYSMIFIASPARGFTTDERTAIVAWKEASPEHKIIINIGIAPLADFNEVDYGMSSEDLDICGYTNGILNNLSSQLRTGLMWGSMAEHGSYYNNYLLNTYSGSHGNFNFLGNEKPFIIDGGTISVTPATAVSPSLQIAAEGGSTFDVLYDGIVSVLSRGSFDFPKPADYGAGDTYAIKYSNVGLGAPWYWYIVDPFNYSLESLLSYWNEEYSGHGWDVESVIAYRDNVMLFTTGNSWFSSSSVFNSYYGNAQFILSLLLERWPDAIVPFKYCVPFVHTTSDDPDYEVTFYDPIT